MGGFRAGRPRLMPTNVGRIAPYRRVLSPACHVQRAPLPADGDTPQPRRTQRGIAATKTCRAVFNQYLLVTLTRSRLFAKKNKLQRVSVTKTTSFSGAM